MAPNNKPNINMQLPRCPYTTIIKSIKSQHLNIFANCIERKEIINSNYFIIFHKKCDNKGATIVIAKVTNSEQIIGGYNPLEWDSSSGYKSTNDSFIFSFTNRTNLQSAKVGYKSNNNDNSVYCDSTYGPAFCSDLYYFQNDDTWSSSTSCYHSNIDIPPSFNVDDYEVFQIIKK